MQVLSAPVALQSTVPWRRDPIDRTNGASLVPCALKGGQQIAAERCITTECHLASSCPFRAPAMKAVEEARREDSLVLGVGRGMAPCMSCHERNTKALSCLCQECESKKPRECLWCAKDFIPKAAPGMPANLNTHKFCDLSCRDKWRDYRKNHPKGVAPAAAPWSYDAAVLRGAALHREVA